MSFSMKGRPELMEESGGDLKKKMKRGRKGSRKTQSGWQACTTNWYFFSTTLSGKEASYKPLNTSRTSFPSMLTTLLRETQSLQGAWKPGYPGKKVTLLTSITYISADRSKEAGLGENLQPNPKHLNREHTGLYWPFLAWPRCLPWDLFVLGRKRQSWNPCVTHSPKSSAVSPLL